MCSINGFLAPQKIRESFLKRFSEIINGMVKKATERGRDSFGYITFNQNNIEEEVKIIFERGKIDLTSVFVNLTKNTTALLSNNRAEPETEYTRESLSKNDIQPFYKDNVYIVHNGLVSNDQKLRKIYGETNSKVDSSIIPNVLQYNIIENLKELEGSFSLGIFNALESNTLYLYRNYNPLTAFYNKKENILIFTSFEKYFRDNLKEEEQFDWVTININPYSGKKITLNSNIIINDFQLDERKKEKALIICSGGLDSVVVASILKKDYDITLLYFKYGCRAENREIKAVEQLANHFNCPYEICDISFLGKLGGSSLTERTIDLADGKDGAEHAKDWVPARNTVLIAIAAAYCDRYKYDAIALGLNLSEGSSFPDNTTEYFESLAHSLNLGTISRPRILCPLSNMMKHELISLGMNLDLDAIALSYSCYTGNENHCGKCSSCYLRKQGFEMLNIKDPAK